MNTRHTIILLETETAEMLDYYRNFLLYTVTYKNWVLYESMKSAFPCVEKIIFCMRQCHFAGGGETRKGR